MVILKNYNKFLVGTVQSFKWEDFYIHRHPSDYARLVRFDSPEEAQTFLDDHPDVEQDFDAWIVPDERAEWKGTIC